MSDVSQSRTLAALHAGLTRRPLPERVAAQLLTLPVIAADPTMRAALAATAAQRAKSSMAESWFAHPPPVIPVAAGRSLFAAWLERHPAALPDDPRQWDSAAILAFAAHLSAAIGKPAGGNSFKADRPGRAQRHAAAWPGHRAYNKRFRYLVRLEEKAATMARQERLQAALLLGKAGLVAGIGAAQFAASPRAAAFVAYLSARRGRRSVFTNAAQSRAFDTVAEALLDRCVADANRTDWLMVARVHPAPFVLARLAPEALAGLLQEWLAALRVIAGDLEQTWHANSFDLETMVVQPGNDSSSWNTLAGAWNQARTAWMAMLAEAGLHAVLEATCPGKVPRLIAADVAAWHRLSGGGLHPDTAVWAALSKPWAVLRGEARCGAADVAAACRAHAVDPAASGWVEARVAARGVVTDATPELVHGVAVGSPEMALLLRNMRVFSGRPVRQPTPGIWARLGQLLRGA